MRLVGNDAKGRPDYEGALVHALRLFGPDLPEPMREAKLAPGRRYRWDFAWPGHQLAVEVQGGVFLPPGKSGHAGAGAQRDHRKANLACILGYRTLFFGPNDLTTWEQGCATVMVIRAAILGPDAVVRQPTLGLEADAR